MITSTDPLSSVSLLLQCRSQIKESPPWLQGTEAELPIREEAQHRTKVLAALRRPPLCAHPCVWAGLRSAQHQPSLSAHHPQLAAALADLCSSLGFHRGPAFVQSNLILQECVPSSCWKEHRQPGQHSSNSSAHSQLHWANELQFQEQPQPWQQCVAEAECTQIPLAPQPPKPGCGPGKPSKAVSMGCMLGFVLPLGQAHHTV